MERLEAELKAAWGRALEAEGDRLVLMERVSAEGREMGVAGEGLATLEQGCGGLEEAVRAVAGECTQVGEGATMECAIVISNRLAECGCAMLFVFGAGGSAGGECQGGACAADGGARRVSDGARGGDGGAGFGA